MRIVPAALALVLALSMPVVAWAQSDQDVIDNIDSIHGDADGFLDLLGILQDAATYGDPVTFGQYGLFPMTVNANGESYDILDEQDLVDNFDTLVMPDTLQAIIDQQVSDLIVTSEGVGLGNGALWITNICLDDTCADTQWGILSINN